MPYFLSPIGNDQQVDTNGNPLSGGKINTYLAGTSTPATTYTTNLGTVAQANPIVLNSLGRPASPIWMEGDIALKFVITNSADVVQFTVDNVVGLNDPQEAFTEWVASGLTPTYISATSFSVVGNQTAVLQANRRIEYVLNSGTYYGYIFSASFGSGITTVVIVPDATNLDATLSSFKYGFISASNTSIPQQFVLAAADKVPSRSSNTQGAYLTNNGTDSTWSPPGFSARSSNTILARADQNKKIRFTAAFTQTFTAVATLGEGTTFSLHNASTGVMTLQANGAETFFTAAGALNSIYMYPGEGFEVISDGSAGFYIRGRSSDVTVETRSVSSGATADFENGFLDPELLELSIAYQGVTVGAAVFLLGRIKKSGAYQSGATYEWGYNYITTGVTAQIGASGDTSWDLTAQRAYTNGATGVITFSKPTLSSAYHRILHSGGAPGAGLALRWDGGLSQSTAAAIQGFRFLPASNAFTAGNFVVRGKR